MEQKRKRTTEELRSLRLAGAGLVPGTRRAVVLDNVRSAYNVGSVFRSCDGFKATQLLLCGLCATPPDPQVRKTAIGAEETVPWRYFPDTLSAVRTLREEGYVVVSVEQAEGSVSLADFRCEPGRDYAFVLGNEVDGVRQDVVDASDAVLEIPQWGSKHSLNVSVCAGIILWTCRPEYTAG